MRAKSGRARPAGWWIPWTFVAGFLLVVAVNGVMIAVAVSSWTGLVTERPYDRGLAYNRNLEAAQAMAALGWRTRLSTTTLGPGRHELVLEAYDRNGAPLSGLRVEGKLERPLEQAADRELVLEPVAAGRYRAALDELAAGQWHARLRLVRGADTYLVSERLVLR